MKEPVVLQETLARKTSDKSMYVVYVDGPTAFKAIKYPCGGHTIFYPNFEGVLSDFEYEEFDGMDTYQLIQGIFGLAPYTEAKKDATELMAACAQELGVGP